MANPRKYVDEILIRFKTDGTFGGAHKRSITIDLDGELSPKIGEAEPVKREDLVDFFGEDNAQMIHAMAVLKDERNALRNDRDKQDRKIEKVRADLANSEAMRRVGSARILELELEIEKLKRALKNDP